jgi:hypothetical protein
MSEWDSFKGLRCVAVGNSLTEIQELKRSHVTPDAFPATARTFPAAGYRDKHDTSPTAWIWWLVLAFGHDIVSSQLSA